MRLKARALIGVLLVACSGPAASAEESRARWWPFGDKEAAPTADTSLPGSGSASATAPSSVMTAQPTSPAVAPKTSTPAVGTGAPLEHVPLPEYTEELPERRWMFQSPLTRVSWPRIHMPEMPKPSLPRPKLWPEKSEVDEARNAWAQASPDAARPSPLQAVKQGAHRVGESTRTAWRKTVDVLTPGDATTPDSSRIARRETRPPFWKRMFTVEEPQQEGPRTVTEWMAQDRLDP